MRATWTLGLLLGGCASNAPSPWEMVSTLERGDYRYLSTQPIDVPMPSGLTLALGDDDYTLTAAEDNLATGTLALEDEADWLYGCPSNYDALGLETYVLEGTFSLGGLGFTDPLLTPDCFDSALIYLSPDRSDDPLGPCVDGTCAVFQQVP